MASCVSNCSIISIFSFFSLRESCSRVSLISPYTAAAASAVAFATSLTAVTHSLASWPFATNVSTCDPVVGTVA